jgi:NADPH:quinone reductase-like Zn-dependent oxidoreductase
MGGTSGVGSIGIQIAKQQQYSESIAKILGK